MELVAYSNIYNFYKTETSANEQVSSSLQSLQIAYFYLTKLRISENVKEII
jgi:hypothetical protein